MNQEQTQLPQHVRDAIKQAAFRYCPVPGSPRDYRKGRREDIITQMAKGAQIALSLTPAAALSSGQQEQPQALELQDVYDAIKAKRQVDADSMNMHPESYYYGMREGAETYHGMATTNGRIEAHLSNIKSLQKQYAEKARDSGQQSGNYLPISPAATQIEGGNCESGKELPDSEMQRGEAGQQAVGAEPVGYLVGGGGFIHKEDADKSLMPWIDSLPSEDVTRLYTHPAPALSVDRGGREDEVKRQAIAFANYLAAERPWADALEISRLPPSKRTVEAFYDNFLKEVCSPPSSVKAD